MIPVQLWNASVTLIKNKDVITISQLSLRAWKYNENNVCSGTPLYVDMYYIRENAFSCFNFNTESTSVKGRHKG